MAGYSPGACLIIEKGHIDQLFGTLREVLKAAAANGWLDHDAVMMEALLAFRRAGADGVLSYFALEAARLLQRG